MQQAERAGGALLPEYHRATPECPHPERWSMYDSMTAEVEVLEFLRTLVTTLKPELVVETGSFLGVSTLWMAEGMRANGFGKIISCEYDPLVFAKAQEKIAASGLAALSLICVMKARWRCRSRARSTFCFQTRTCLSATRKSAAICRRSGLPG